MSRKPTPFATAQVLRGIELAIRFTEPCQHLSNEERADIERARGWLEHAKQTRKG